VIILDANILVYVYNSDAPQHHEATQWLRKLFAGEEIVAIPWVTAWAFLRICTNSRIWPDPKPIEDAFLILRDWLAQPRVVSLEPGPRHLKILENLVSTYGVTGPLMTDATLAGLAIENGASVASTDQDFRRFPNVRWINPLDKPTK
jgi:toxin-antitoxin system PIN domain toxin